MRCSSEKRFFTSNLLLVGDWTRNRAATQIRGDVAAFIVAAGLVAYLASRYQAWHQLMMGLVRRVDDSLNLTKLSSGSNFPDITAIYDLVIHPLPIFLASYLVLDLAFPLQGRLARSYVFKQYVSMSWQCLGFLFSCFSHPFRIGLGKARTSD